MSSLAIDELKSHLSTFIQSLNSGATTPEIISGFRKLHGRSISKARVELEDKGLTSLVNSVGRLRPSKFAGEPELFPGFGVPNTIVVRDDHGRSVHVPISKASISEAKTWAHSQKRPPQQTSEQIEMQRLIEEIEPFAKDGNTTLETAMLASKAGEKKRKG